MKRDKPRPDFGWETPQDIYQELRRLMPTGEWVYLQRDDLHWFEWCGRIRGERYAHRFSVSEPTLRREKAGEIAAREVAVLRRELEELHHEANQAQRKQPQRRPQDQLGSLVNRLMGTLDGTL